MFEEMLSQMAGSSHTLNPISGEELKSVREDYKHIEDLKPGDKVVYKSRWKATRHPKNEEVCEVFRVFPPKPVTDKSGSNVECMERDFSILFEDGDGDYAEMLFDSRRFKRVE
jgi:hypothetical protein